MKRIFLFVLVVVLVCGSSACGSKTDNKKSAVEQYKSVAQEYIDKGDTKTAKKALEEGIALTNDEGLKKMLEEINAVDEVKEETSSVEEPKAESVQAETTQPEATPSETVQESPTLKLDVEAINAYINNEKKFIDFDSKKEATIETLPKVNGKYIGKAHQYAVVDLDGDYVKELLVEYDMSGDTAILHIQNNSCVAYYVPYRGIKGLKIDGTADYSNSAFESGVQRFTFSDNGLSSKNVVVYDDESNIYTAEGKNVTKDECLDILSKHYSKEDVIWNSIN